MLKNRILLKTHYKNSSRWIKIVDDVDIANNFNIYFNIAEDLESLHIRLYDAPLNYFYVNIQNSYFIRHVTLAECVKIIVSLR